MSTAIEQETLNRLANPISTKIISDTPGRLRLRIAESHRQVEKMKNIASILEAKPHIIQVRLNIYYGSIVINYDDTVCSWQNVSATLQDMGIIFSDITQGSTEAATSVTNVVAGLNKQVKKATDSAVDLRFLFPWGLGMLAIRQLLIKGLELESIPWYVLAWYGFDSFIKLHGTEQLQPNQESE